MLFPRLTATLVLLTLTWIPAPAQASLVVFNFLGDGGPFDFNATSGVFTTTIASHGIAGMQLTFQAYFNGSLGGNINGADEFYGINAPLDGDQVSQIDGGAGAPEKLRISFLAPPSVSNISLASINIGAFDANDAGTLTIGANSSNLASGLSTPIPIHSNLHGQFLEVAWTAGTTGFSFSGLTLNVTAVPEPNSFFFGCLICGLLSLAVGRRRFIELRKSAAS